MDQQTLQRVSFQSACPDEIGQFWQTTLGWQVAFDRAGSAPGQFRLDTATLNGLSIGHQRFKFGYTGSAEATESYVAWVTTRGRSMYQRRRDQYTGGPHQVLAYRPDSVHRVARADAATELTYVALEPWVLERHLENLLERPVSSPIALAPATRLQPGVGQTWWSVVHVLSRILLNPDESLFHAAVVDPLREAMMTSLLLSVHHQHRDTLTRPAPPCHPRHVRRAVEAIHAFPERPYTVAGLAGLAGTSIRTLQQGFRTHLNTCPMEYLRDVRLARAHDELAANDTVSIADVACGWGFTHLGRFASAYAKRYGHLPSHRRPPQHRSVPVRKTVQVR